MNFHGNVRFVFNICRVTMENAILRNFPLTNIRNISKEEILPNEKWYDLPILRINNENHFIPIEEMMIHYQECLKGHLVGSSQKYKGLLNSRS